MFELLKVNAEEARKRIVIIGWNVEDKGPRQFLQIEELLGKGSMNAEEQFEGTESYATALLCYSSGTTGKPKGVEVGLILLSYRA